MSIHNIVFGTNMHQILLKLKFVTGGGRGRNGGGKEGLNGNQNISSDGFISQLSVVESKMRDK